MIFDKKSSFIRTAFKTALETYNPSVWGSVCPVLLSKLRKEPEYNKKDRHTFYPYYFKETPKCFEEVGQSLHNNPRFQNTFTIHLNTKVTQHITKYKKNTVCADLFTDFRIFNDI